MGKYSIRELERLSTIKAHTLRIWEKRYNLFSPDRSSTNIRAYSDNDLKKLLKISTLTKSGVKISKVVNLSDEEIDQMISNIEDGQALQEKRVNDLVIPMIEFDESKFNELYGNYINEVGIEGTFESIIYPFLEKIGLLWLTDEVEPAQEHFITHLIRQKLLVAIDGLPEPSQMAKKVLLFLPEGEYHELGLLFMSFLFKLRGFQVYYLGQSIPVEQVCSSTEQIKPDWVITYTVVKPQSGIQSLIDGLEKCNCQDVFFLMVNDSKFKEARFTTKVQKVKSCDELLK